MGNLKFQLSHYDKIDLSYFVGFVKDNDYSQVMNFTIFCFTYHDR